MISDSSCGVISVISGRVYKISPSDTPLNIIIIFRAGGVTGKAKQHYSIKYTWVVDNFTADIPFFINYSIVI